MYKHLTEAFGSYTKHTLVDESAGQRLTFVPGFGSCVLDLQLKGISILDGYKTPVELEANRWAKNTVLFPFPNRLNDGTYAWDGVTYQFPINEPLSGTALHGFGQDKPMQAFQFQLKEDHASVLCRYSDPGDQDFYPFPFTFSIQFLLKNPGSVEIEMRFRNDGTDALPVGLGWHPYFTLADRIDDMHLQLPAAQMVGVDSRMIPTGKKYPYDDFSDLRRIGATVLDNCFSLPAPEGVAEILLKGAKGALRYWQETGPSKYNFFQVFTPPDRNAIAIEPMTCNADAFNNGEGLIRLEPGKEVGATFGIQVVE